MHFPEQIKILMNDGRITDIAINGLRSALVRIGNRWFEVEAPSQSPEELQELAMSLAESANQGLNYRQPVASFMMGDWRVSAVLPFEVCSDTNLVFRRVSNHSLSHSSTELFSDSRSRRLLDLAHKYLDARQSVLIAGAAGSGKTTLLRALLRRYSNQRIITIEDVAELNLDLPNSVALVARESNSDGFGSVTVEQLLAHALRMSPDRIALGEVRSVELVAMLDALNTGHSGAGATIHANSLDDVASRIEALGLRAGLPLEVIARLTQSAIGLVVFVSAQQSFAIDAIGVPKASATGLEVVSIG
jgi:pilus assembly protein CpaF